MNRAHPKPHGIICERADALLGEAAGQIGTRPSLAFYSLNHSVQCNVSPKRSKETDSRGRTVAEG